MVSFDNKKGQWPLWPYIITIYHYQAVWKDSDLCPSRQSKFLDFFLVKTVMPKRQNIVKYEMHNLTVVSAGIF